MSHKFAIFLFLIPLYLVIGQHPIIAKKKNNISIKNKKDRGAPGTVVNRLRYIVGDQAITDMDIAEMKKDIKYLNRIYVRNGKKRSSAIDELIKRAIITMEARKESLIVSDSRIDNEIKKRKNISGARSNREFQRLVAKNSGVPYRIWVKNLPFQILRSNLIRLKISPTPPSEREMKRFYRKNRNQVGFEVAYREIIFAPRTIAEERRLSAIARKIWKKVKARPQIFKKIARTHPDNSSYVRRKGGYRHFVSIHKLARRDSRLAGILYKLRSGAVGPLFVDSRRRYVIVMLVRKRSTPYTRVRLLIRQRMMIKREESGFDEWLEEKKKEFAIIKVK